MPEVRVPLIVGDRLQEVHLALHAELPEVQRVAIALYDPKADELRTFVHSTDGETPLRQYRAPLSAVPSLAALARSGQDRVIHDLGALAGSPSRHTRCILESGYRSSYTFPVLEDGHLAAFVFYDSLQVGYFSPEVVRRLAVHSRLIAMLVLQSLSPVPLLLATVRVANRLTHYRDMETGAHLDRMAAFSRLIASTLAADRGLSDEFVEFVHFFAPLHDMGKIAIPDHILFKQSALDEDELAIMRSHVAKGVEMVDVLVDDAKLTLMPHAGMLRNIVAAHHECVDGSGYPNGLVGEEIPIEARVVAVADVFDALTTERPYKRSWPVPDAFTFLEERSGLMFDQDCVAALVAARDEVEEVRRRFADPEGPAGSHEGYLTQV